MTVRLFGEELVAPAAGAVDPLIDAKVLTDCGWYADDAADWRMTPASDWPVPPLLLTLGQECPTLYLDCNGARAELLRPVRRSHLAYIMRLSLFYAVYGAGADPGLLRTAPEGVLT